MVRGGECLVDVFIMDLSTVGRNDSSQRGVAFPARYLLNPATDPSLLTCSCVPTAPSPFSKALKMGGDSTYIQSLVDQIQKTAAETNDLGQDGTARAKLLQLSRQLTGQLEQPDELISNVAFSARTQPSNVCGESVSLT